MSTYVQVVWRYDVMVGLGVLWPMASRVYRPLPDRPPLGIAAGIKVVVWRARQRGRPLCWACLGVTKALHDIHCAWAALLRHDVAVRLVVAVLREVIGQKCWPRVARVTADRGVLVLKSVRQGALGTPMLWNVMTIVVICRCLAAMARLRWNGAMVWAFGGSGSSQIVWLS